VKLWGVAIVGLLLGLVGGLIVTWFVVPLEYYDTYPPMLDAGHRREWIRMAAWSYGLEGNWERLQTRLIDLPSAEIREGAVDVLEQAIVREQSVTVLQRLAQLAAAYGASSPAVAIYSTEGAPSTAMPTTVPATRPSSTPTRAPALPLPTSTPPPSLTPTLTPSAPITDTLPIRVISQTLTCDRSPRIAVSLTLSRTIEVRGREEHERVEMPMREIWLIWDDGADRAITGFRPELGMGYADFDVIPGRSYNLYVDRPYGIPIRTLQAEPCPQAEGVGWVSRHLILQEIERDESALEITPTVTSPLLRSSTPGLTVTATIAATDLLTTTETPTPTSN
jgi:hypothetical protein